MAALLRRAQVTRDDVVRNQLSVAVSQAEIAGDQADIQGGLVWGQLERSGRDFEKMFQSYRQLCGATEELKAKGAPPVSVHRWKNACRGLMESEQRFAPVLQRVLAEGAELRRFQAEEKRKRAQFIQQAERL